MAEQAKGIPNKRYYGAVDKNVQPGDIVDYMKQKHNAFIRGPHYDYRIGKDKSTGLHSWATTRKEPKPGESISLIQQPTHSFDYLGWEGDIPRGTYGGGDVSVEELKKILLTKVNPKEIHFTDASDKGQRRSALINYGDKHWSLINPKPVEDPDAIKPKYKNVPANELDDYIKDLPDTAVAQPKIDGALNFLKLNEKPELFSHRLSKANNKPIVHTERFFGNRPELKNLPTDLRNSLLMAELYGERNGKVIPPQELGGLLNSTIENSLNKQRDSDTELKALLFDIVRRGNKKVDEPYTDRQEHLKEIIKYLPPNKFSLPEQAQGKEEIKALLDKIRSGKHPLTNEGVIVRNDKDTAKLKLKDEQDVFIKSIFEGEGKYKGKGAGGFEYGFSPEDKVVGRVGGGLSDELRKALLANPDDYIGRKARVISQGAFPNTGALRSPNLLALHEG